jgi:hypothetical protein
MKPYVHLSRLTGRRSAPGHSNRLTSVVTILVVIQPETVRRLLRDWTG